ncbi:hypothetical protein JF50_20230 [Pseudoalteromonas luteoviolacea]|uniref:OmpR/PhoB-type domain-containing protein n=1 Tax=Pseudoalteromonas luteoviolacea TaxID=43657 RepID=A0A0C1QKF9_9GAMM|nr:winged helix-turn-helix domain-containing protein [Pseudoalteromonas luteoviolacea]KID55537.1 hypothetical protein JF50_20230 [Pseudoalteromonas luteoviolacea]
MNDNGLLEMVKEVHFGVWILDLKRQTIFDGDETRELEPLLYKTLLYFIEHNDAIVTRQELVDNVWQQSFVDDNAINRAIFELRKACKSEHDPSTVIKTHYRKGYSLVPKVKLVTFDAVEAEEQSKGLSQEALNISPPSSASPSLTLNSASAPTQSGVDDRVAPKTTKQLNYIGLVLSIFIVVVLAFIAQYFQSTEQDTEYEFKDEPLVWKMGTYEYPIVSHTKEFVAYSFKGLREAVSSIHLKNLNSHQDIVVVQSDYDAYPIGWKANQNTLFYQIISVGENSVCEVWEVSIDANNEPSNHAKLFDCDSSYKMSATGLDDVVIYSKFGYRNKKGAAAIVAWEKNSGNEYQITSPMILSYGDYYTSISGAGDKLAFLRFQPYGTQIFVTNVDGSEQYMVADLDYRVRTVQWMPSRNSLFWFNHLDKELNFFDLDSSAHSKSSLNVSAEVREMVPFSDGEFFYTSDWANYDLLSLDVTTQRVETVSNVELQERIVAPLNIADQFIMLLEGSRHSLWRVEGDNRYKLTDLDFENTIGLDVSADGKSLLVTTTSHLHVYDLEAGTWKNEVFIKGSIQSAFWNDSHSIIYTKSVVHGNKNYVYAYDFESGFHKELLQGTVTQAKFIQEHVVLFTDAKNRFYLYNTIDNTKTLLFERLDLSDLIWSSDQTHLYFTDNIAVYKKPLSQSGQEQVIYEIDKDSAMIKSLQVNGFAQEQSAQIYIGVLKNSGNQFGKFIPIENE